MRDRLTTPGCGATSFFSQFRRIIDPDCCLEDEDFRESIDILACRVSASGEEKLLSGPTKVSIGN